MVIRTIISISLLLTSQFSNSQSLENLGLDLSGYSTDYFSIPLIDLNSHQTRQVEVDREVGVYLGHPSTVLLNDGRTLYCVYPQGHGKGQIILKRSDDGGLTWSERLPTPENWSSSLETPTIFPVQDSEGIMRHIIFSGLYPIRMSISVDQCKSWTELSQVGDWGGIVAMGDLVPLKTSNGHYLAMFHDDGRFFSAGGRSDQEQELARSGYPLFKLCKTLSTDGGMTWSQPEVVFGSRVIHLCEPGIIRSPDGKQLAVLLRENARKMNSHIIFSDDEGSTWTSPRELPNALTGDRHQAIYAHDGRLVISFRDNSPALSRYMQLRNSCKDCDTSILKEQAGPVSPTAGDWVAWIGSYDDLTEGREGQYRLRLKDNTKGTDCAYPALQLLPDGTILAITYGHWEQDEAPYILSVRFTMQEIDSLAHE
ncbi:MAG: glycoside hydrolase [Saprospiraceae bacterium]|nr:glycoside hydrolase [Saprospiraceae bacterium]